MSKTYNCMCFASHIPGDYDSEIFESELSQIFELSLILETDSDRLVQNLRSSRISTLSLRHAPRGKIFDEYQAKRITPPVRCVC